MGILGTTLFLFTFCQSLALSQVTPDKETKEKEENVESGGGAVHQLLVGASGDDGETESVPGGIGTALEVNLTPSFQNGQVGQLPPLATAVNNNHLRSDLLGSQHPANHPEYFTADEFRDPSSLNGAQFPRTQILDREQVFVGESDLGGLTQRVEGPQSDYLTAVQYLQPQMVNTLAYTGDDDEDELA